MPQQALLNPWRSINDVWLCMQDLRLQPSFEGRDQGPHYMPLLLQSQDKLKQASAAACCCTASKERIWGRISGAAFTSLSGLYASNNPLWTSAVLWDEGEAMEDDLWRQWLGAMAANV